MPKTEQSRIGDELAAGVLNEWLKSQGEKISYLASRWQDESEYEDWNDYLTGLEEIMPKGATELSAKKKPFGFKMKFRGATVVVTVSETQVKWKAQGHFEMPADQAQQLTFIDDAVNEVKKYARENYEHPDIRWDIVIEAWDDDEIIKAIGDATTTTEALLNVRNALVPISEAQAEHDAEAKAGGADEIESDFPDEALDDKQIAANAEIAKTETKPAKVAKPMPTLDEALAKATSENPGRYRTVLAVTELTKDGDPKRVIVRCTDPQTKQVNGQDVSVCAGEREIAVQDLFQVVCCAPCADRKVRKARRNRTKVKNKALKAALKAAKER